MSTVIFIPARGGSSRIKNKNIQKVGPYPLIVHTINLAKKITFADEIFISTDSEKILNIAKKFSLNPNYKRPKKFATKLSPDYDWIIDAINFFEKNNKKFENFIILRPTNPFRTLKTINKAFKIFKKSNSDSLRAVKLCDQHPYKMWNIKSNYLSPLFNKKIQGQPGHSNPYQILPKIYIQDASLEISKISNLHKYKNISGKKIIPFFMPNIEGFDINNPSDLEMARQIFKGKL